MTAHRLARPADQPPPATGSAALARAIGNLRDATEPAFVAMGTRLGGTADLLDRIQAPLIELNRIEAEGSLAELRGLAAAFRADLVAFRAELLEALAEIAALDQNARQIEQQLSNIRRAAKTMNMVVMNARINVAALGSAKARLGSFSEDATALVAQTMELLGNLEAPILRLQRTAAQAQDRSKALTATIETGTNRAVASLTEATEKFARDIAGFAGSGKGITAQIGELLSATAQAVASLQIGDTTRQRLDHVIAILDWPAPPLAPLLADLGAAQLADTARCHEDGVTQLQASTLALETGLNRLVQGHLLPFGSGDTQGAPGLQDSLALIGATISEALAAQDVLLGSAAMFTADLAELTRLVERGDAAEGRMRMIGQNAVIACADLGQDGLALKAISLQLQELARQTAGHFPVLRTGLQEMVGQSVRASAKLTAASDRARNLSETSAKPLCRQMDAIVAVLDAARAIVLEARKTIGGPIGQLDQLARHARQLAELGTRQQPALPLEASPEAETTLAEIAKIYTMSRERDIHRKAAGIAPGTADASHGASPAPPGESAVFF